MNKELLKVALRQNAIYIETKDRTVDQHELNQTTSVLVANLAKLGFGLSEELLRAVNQLTPGSKQDILRELREVMGIEKGWKPLVKGWDEPTGESIADHIITYFANLFGSKNGTTLPCGHLIPYGTFPLERYNGCPYCGQAFDPGKSEIHYGQGSSLKVLELWGEKEMEEHLRALLSARTALDATGADSLKILLRIFGLPTRVSIEIKETLMLAVDTLVEEEKAAQAGELFRSPQDIMRYLWYKHTGFLQIIKPGTLSVKRAKNELYYNDLPNVMEEKRKRFKQELKLKYSRKECRMVAEWINALPQSVESICEAMHPKRAMWVRFIRALRLAEYSKRKGMGKLKGILDRLYNKEYRVWQGELDQAYLSLDETRNFEMLKEKPSVFARSLFATMLWYSHETTLKHFREVAPRIPARLLATLSMYAPLYFDREHQRTVSPLGGAKKRIEANHNLALYSDEQLSGMAKAVESLFLGEMTRRYKAVENQNRTVYIDQGLFMMPLAIGDRSESIQDIPSSLMGQRFAVAGEKVRLFMEWGKGLPRQHLDMDLSASIAFEGRTEVCSYYHLVATGAKHSGDIQSIPHMSGTAEYIELDMKTLERSGAKFVTFTCNAYTRGELNPNMVVGWMNSEYPMKISRMSGVAYDPSTVQHQVRISYSLSKGLVFGILDVAAREIVWIEMSFDGQTIRSLDQQAVAALLDKLKSKLTVGELLLIKADAQGLERVNNISEADEVYDRGWAVDSAKVSQLLVD